MSTVFQILNTVEAMSDNDDLTVGSVVSLMLVEKWRRHYDENLRFDELTSEEKEIIFVWLSFNSLDYSHKHQIVKDMRELFDGLSEDAIHEFLNRTGQQWIKPLDEYLNQGLADWERELLEY